MKRKVLNLLILVTGSVPAAFAGDADTTFKKNDPSLYYTTRDFYIDVPADCYEGQVCLQDFALILTFNVGINSRQEVKQIGFKDADLEFKSKSPGEHTYVTQTFDKYRSQSQLDGWKVNVIFDPDKVAGTTAPSVKQFVFDGTVSQNHIQGILTFYLKSGEIFKININ